MHVIGSLGHRVGGNAGRTPFDRLRVDGRPTEGPLPARSSSGCRPAMSGRRLLPVWRGARQWTLRQAQGRCLLWSKRGAEPL
jgi:hypothetical protein